MLNKKTLEKLDYRKKDRNEKASLFGREAFFSNNQQLYRLG